MGAERTFPREDKESRRTPSLRSVPRYVSPIGARYPVQSGQAGAGGSPISPVYGWVLSPVSEGGKKLRIFNSCNVVAFLWSLFNSIAPSRTLSVS